MDMADIVSSNSFYFIIGLSVLSIIIVILLIIILAKQSKLKRNYKKFFSGKRGEDFESRIFSKFDDIDQLKSDINQMKSEIEIFNEKLENTYQKTGIVKYDAFNEMGGKLSFVLALLDKNNNGVLINSVHSSREGCYVYLKEIIKGESFLELSKDEKNALKEAINSDNIME